MSLLSLVNTTRIPASAIKARRLGAAPLARDPYAPNYEIIIRGGQGAQPVTLDDSIKKYIDEISFEDNADQFDSLNITFSNQVDAMGGGQILSLLDSKIFAEGHILEIMMGWGKTLRTVGAARIAKVLPDFPESGPPSFTIEGFDLLHKASRNRPKGGVSYKGFRDSQVASIIGSRNGFDIKVTDPRSFDGIRKTVGVFDRIQKKGVSDYEFLKKVAEINGYDLYSKFNPNLKKFGLFFQPGALKNQKEVFTFVYNEGDIDFNSTLLSYTPSLDSADQGTDFEIFIVKNKEVGGTKVDFINRLTTEEQKKIKVDQERRFTGGNFGPQGGKQTPNDDSIQVAFKAFGRSFRFPQHKRFKDEFTARRAIEQFVIRQKENFITGTGELKGQEAVQSRQVHNLQGLGQRFSGKYYFTQVTHTINKSSGYRSSFSARKVIDDTVVQSPPTLNLSDNDKTLEKIKGLR